MFYKILISVMAMLALSGVSQAAGNAKAGEAKAGVCMGCHGPNGQGGVNPAWPSLAGQHANYLAKQLADLKVGDKRKDPTMSGQAAALSGQDMADLAAFFASKPAAQGGADKNLVALGKKIYRGGNAAKGVAACMGCHGPTGSGNPGGAISFPRLSGQSAAYVVKAMNDFRSGARSNDANAMMRTVAEKMSDKEIEAVASYVSGLH